MRKLLFLSIALLMSAVSYADEPVMVIITAGQSNTAGRCTNDSLPDYIKNLGTHFNYCYWSFTNGQTRKAEEEGVFRPFWPESERTGIKGACFAYDAIVYYLIEKAVQKPFYVIKHAEGGTSIDPACKSTNNHHWSADPAFLDSTTSANLGGQSLLKALESNIDKSIDKLKSEGKEFYIACMLWHQGESDRSMPSQYHDNLKGVISHIRQHLVEKTGNQEYSALPVICGTVPTNSIQYCQQIEQSLFLLEKEDHHFHVIPVNDATFIGDQLHFDRATAERFGQEMYNKILDLCRIR